MVFHLAGFAESLDPGGAFVNIAALQDDRLFTSADNLRVPDLTSIVMLAGGACDDGEPRMRLDSPTLDELTRYEISPLNVGSDADVEPGSPQRLIKMLSNPMQLGKDENLTVQLLSDPATTARLQWCLLWFADGAINPVSSGRMFTVRALGTTTLVADTWTPVALTLDENLPPGRYQIVGMAMVGATAIAARVVGREGDQWRPGCLAADLIADLTDPVFRNGGMGVWAEFPFTQLPDIEVLAAAADTAQTVHLDLIRIGS